MNANTKELKWEMEFDNIDDFLEQRERLKKLLLTFCSKHKNMQYNMESEYSEPMFSIKLKMDCKTLTDGEILGTSF